MITDATTTLIQPVVVSLRPSAVLDPDLMGLDNISF